MAELAVLAAHIERIQTEAEAVFAQVRTPSDAELLRVKYLGRNGLVAQLFSQMGALPAEARPLFGARLNTLKTALTQRLAQATSQAAVPATEALSTALTLPGVAHPVGRRHPLRRALREITGIFQELAFEIVEGPEIEQEHYNFDGLNIPSDHPSREGFDTFYLDLPAVPGKGRWLLRSHTSPAQVRIMESRKPPLRVVVPGVVFRPDQVDASHSFMFHQVEGLLVDTRVTFADLKGLLDLFLRRFFGPHTKTRFRPHFFPFTEPSAEVDIACQLCQGEGCSVCGRKGWLEILGCGMVHPEVFRKVGYPVDRVQGIAFGLGVERLVMLRHGMDDIRLFYENDLRFLAQL